MAIFSSWLLLYFRIFFFFLAKRRTSINMLVLEFVPFYDHVYIIHEHLTQLFFMVCSGIRSGLRCDNRFSTMAPAINNTLKQEHPSNLDSESLVGDSLLLTRKLSAMPPWFPATVREGTCTSLGSKALLMGGGNNQLLVFGNDTPPWKGSLETAGTPQSSCVSSWKKGWERSATCNVALKVETFIGDFAWFNFLIGVFALRWVHLSILKLLRSESFNQNAPH